VNSGVAMEGPGVLKPTAVVKVPLAVVEPMLMVAAEPAVVAEEMRLVLPPRVPEPVLLKRMTKRPVLLGVGESGCCHRPRQSQQ